MKQKYSDRTSAMHVDGTPIFSTEEDRASEATVASAIESAWGCTLHRFGVLSPIDWFAVRDGRVTGVLELKSRSHASTKYRTVFLNVRKWLALLLASAGMGVPAIYVVRFTDAVMWCRIADVDATNVRVGGCGAIVKAISDIEPVIEIPVSDMKILAMNKAEVA